MHADEWIGLKMNVYECRLMHMSADAYKLWRMQIKKMKADYCKGSQMYTDESRWMQMIAVEFRRISMNADEWKKVKK